MSQERILIVDDDQHLVGVLQIWFEKANFAVVAASNGDEALGILRGSGPLAFVLTDFMMPERNGIELLRVLKANPNLSHTPVMMMSNNSNPEFRQRAMELGAVAFLLKTDGARAVAENAMLAVGRVPEGFEGKKPSPLSTVQVQAMRESLVALLRLTSRTDGLPIEVRDALVSAGKLVEALFAAVPVN
jgi:CheY-like chemotaxis protein